MILTKAENVKKAKLNTIRSAKKKKHSTKADGYIENLKKQQGYMPFTEHLEELRSKLLRSLAGIGISSILCLFFYKPIWFYVMGPLVDLIQEGAIEGTDIQIVTSRLQDDFLIQFKVVLMIGVLISVPYILFELWSFVLPALQDSRKKVGYIILVSSMILFLLGTLFARFYIWPLVIKFFLFEWVPPPIPASDGTFVHTQKYLSIPDYVSFFMSFHFAFGVCFELPVVSALLGLMGIIQSRMFLRSWRIALMLIAFVSASLTPPDWISMLALMLPLIVLFFISAFFVFLIEKGFLIKSKKRPINKLS